MQNFLLYIITTTDNLTVLFAVCSLYDPSHPPISVDKKGKKRVSLSER